MKRSSHSRTMEFVQKLRPIDNAFFPVLGQDPGVMEEILRVILNDNTLTVEKVIAEYTLPNLPGRGVRLDSFCETGDGHRINVEVQKADDDDHIRRCRYNAAGMTWKEAEKGTRFKDLPDVCVVYITEHDFLHGGRTVYHVDKILRENGSLIDDGSSVIYVNTAVNDGSAISDLMRCFLQKTVNDPRFPRLSERVHQYKNTEKGAAEMCEELERYIDEITEEIEACAGGAGSSLGTGGMATKIAAARKATDAGVNMVLANGEEPSIISDILSGEEVGTLFTAKK